MINKAIPLMFFAFFAASFTYAQPTFATMKAQVGDKVRSVQEQLPTGLPYVEFSGTEGNKIFFSAAAGKMYRDDASVFNSLVKMPTPSGDIYVLSTEKDTYIDKVYNPIMAKLSLPFYWVPPYDMGGTSRSLASVFSQNTWHDDNTGFVVHRFFHKNLLSWFDSLKKSGVIKDKDVMNIFEASNQDLEDRVLFQCQHVHHTVYNTLVQVVNHSALKVGGSPKNYWTLTPLDMDKISSSLKAQPSLLEADLEVYAKAAELILQAVDACVLKEYWDYEYHSKPGGRTREDADLSSKLFKYKTDSLSKLKAFARNLAEASN